MLCCPVAQRPHHACAPFHRSPHIPHDFGGLPPTFILLILQIGLPGVALVLTFGQLVSQIYVEEYTLQFLNLYGCEFVVRLALAAEWIGICHFSWLLFHTASRIACYSVRKAQLELDAAARNSARANSTDAIMDGDAEVRLRCLPERAPLLMLLLTCLRTRALARPTLGRTAHPCHPRR